MFDKGTFDFFGLYPRPIGEMNKTQLLASSAITVFFIIGCVTSGRMILEDWVAFGKLVGSTAFFVSGMYFLLSNIQRHITRCKQHRSSEKSHGVVLDRS